MGAVDCLGYIGASPSRPDGLKAIGKRGEGPALVLLARNVH